MKYKLISIFTGIFLSVVQHRNTVHYNVGLPATASAAQKEEQP